MKEREGEWKDVTGSLPHVGDKTLTYTLHVVFHILQLRPTQRFWNPGVPSNLIQFAIMAQSTTVIHTGYTAQRPGLGELLANRLLLSVLWIGRTIF